MKKTIFSFAIAAVAALMASCGGKTGNAAGGEATAENEQATEQTAAAASEGTSVEKEHFTATFPSNFKDIESFNNDNQVLFRIPKPDSEYGHLGQISITATPGWEKGLDAWIQEHMNSHSSAKAADDVTCGGITWKQVRHDALDSPIYLFAELPEKGVVEVNLQKIDIDNADAKSVLESIKLK